MRWWLAVVVASAASLAVPALASAESPPLTIDPISAVFLPDKSATQYTVSVHGGVKKPTFIWTLSLELVDKYEAASPYAPDAHADVDLGCNNRKLAGRVSLSRDESEWKNQGDTFLWYHGDLDGCNHKLMGPSGHQGVVSVEVTDGQTTCIAVIKGTNLTPSAVQGEAPACTAGGAVPTKAALALKELDTELDKDIATPGQSKLTPAGLSAALGRIDDLLSRFLDALPRTNGERTGIVIDRLLAADTYLQDDVPNAHRIQDAVDALGHAAGILSKLSDQLDDFDVVAAGARGIAKEAQGGKLTFDELRAKAKTLAKVKEIALSGLPSLMGISFVTLYDALDAIDADLMEAEHPTLGSSETALQAARADKQDLEHDLKINGK